MGKNEANEQLAKMGQTTLIVDDNGLGQALRSVKDCYADLMRTPIVSTELAIERADRLSAEAEWLVQCLLPEVTNATD